MKKKFIHFFSLICFIVSFTTARGSIDCVVTQIDNQMPQPIIFTLKYNAEHFRQLLYIPPTTILSLPPEERNKICIPEAVRNGRIEISIAARKAFRIADLYCMKNQTPTHRDPQTHERRSSSMYEIKIFLDELPIYTYTQPLTWDIIKKESKNETTEIFFTMTINSFGKIILRPVGEIISAPAAPSSSAKSTRTQSMF